METITGAEFRRETVRLGDKRFVDCKFVDCDLVFDGAAFESVDCAYLNSRFTIEGAAIHTLQFLHMLWNGGAWALVEEFGTMHTGQPIRFIDD